MKHMVLCIICTICLLLSACGILPEEAQYEKAPIISQYQKEQWEFAYVQRGDITLSQAITCTYLPVQTQTLSFTQADARFDAVFVQIGDRVQKGQLLAQLDLSGVSEQLEMCNTQIQRLQLQIAAVEENRTLALERVRIMYADSTQQELESQEEKIHAQFDLQRQPLQDELEIAQMQLQDCQTKLLNRQIRAGMDGVVTYLRPIKQGDRITAGDKLIVIEDSASSVFCADSRYWQYFQPGQEHWITVAGEEYSAVVVSEAELGIPESEKTEGSYALTYFKLKDPTVYLEDGDVGMITLVLEAREGVLLIPESAVIPFKGRNIVYYQDKNGMKAYKEVEVGLDADGMIEIKAGLTEGECIIAG